MQHIHPQGEKRSGRPLSTSTALRVQNGVWEEKIKDAYRASLHKGLNISLCHLLVFLHTAACLEPSSCLCLTGTAYGSMAYQIQMIKNQRRFVHLPQDKQHFIVYKFLEFFQVAIHLLLQLISYLWGKTMTKYATEEMIAHHLDGGIQNDCTLFKGECQ